MRIRGPCAVVPLALLLGSAICAPWSVHAQTTDASKVLSAARDALGGEVRLEAVRTLIVSGRTRQLRGQNLVPIEFEIQVQLPDQYSRRDEFPAQDAGPAASGFSGDQLIQIPAPPPPVARRGGAGPTAAQQEAALRARVVAQKQEFARLLLGLFARSFSAYPLTFEYVAQAEAPEGTADVLDAKGPDNFTARLFVDTRTHLPIMVSWKVSAPPARGGGNAAPASPPSTLENRMYFGDFRDVDGLKLPFRIRRAVGSDTIEETTFDRFRLNARTDPKRFEVSK